MSLPKKRSFYKTVILTPIIFGGHYPTKMVSSKTVSGNGLLFWWEDEREGTAPAFLNQPSILPSGNCLFSSRLAEMKAKMLRTRFESIKDAKSAIRLY